MAKKKNKNLINAYNQGMQDAIKENSLSSLVNSFTGGLEGSNLIYKCSAQASQISTLARNNRNYFISNFRYLLSESYIEHGLIQTMIDLPVDDAFRTEIEFSTNELTKEEQNKIKEFIEEKDCIEKFKYAIKWSRLFGGGALIIMTGEDDISVPLDTKKLKDMPVEFVPVDLWELYYGDYDVNEQKLDYYRDMELRKLLYKPEIYNYYGVRIHKSRIFRIEGKEAPSFVRPRLRGWGFSVLETLVRGFNQYLKGVDSTFEMLDEVKVDVYSINNLATALKSPVGMENVRKRITLSNQLKSYLNALVLDKNDGYESKSHSSSFSGLAEVMKEIRYQIASDLRMPLSKLFGIGSSGFSSGEDDIKNYNTMVETEIRSKVKNHLKNLYKLCSLFVLGKEIKSVNVLFGSLDYETPKDLTIRKNSEYQRAFIAYDHGLMNISTLKEMINKNNMLPLPLEVNDTIYDTMPLQIAKNKQEYDSSDKITIKDLKVKEFN